MACTVWGSLAYAAAAAQALQMAGASRDPGEALWLAAGALTTMDASHAVNPAFGIESAVNHVRERERGGEERECVVVCVGEIK